MVRTGQGICRWAVAGWMASLTPAHAEPPKVERFGTLADGREVVRYTLRNARGMTVRILSLGGIITEISVPDGTGRFGNVVLTKPDLAAYATGGNFSSLLGRYANRISGGGFTLDGRRYDLAGAAANGMVLHGGPGNFSQQVWAGVPFGGARGPSGVTLSHVSPDGTNGFPGTMRVSARFTLSDNNKLRLEFKATTDKATVVNLSHHVYFNLAGSDTPAAEEQCVQILADRYAVADRQAMTGELRPVAGTPFDLRRPIRLADRVNKGFALLPRGFDTPFVLRGGPGTSVAARAWDPASGRTLELRTTETTVQFYTPAFHPGAPRPAAPAPGTPPAVGHVPGFAMEPEHLPESPNHPTFPSTVLRPGRVFRSAIEWRFGTYAPAAATCPVAPGG
jgi:aldose 1-epimerase